MFCCFFYIFFIYLWLLVLVHLLKYRIPWPINQKTKCGIVQTHITKKCEIWYCTEPHVWQLKQREKFSIVQYHIWQTKHDMWYCSQSHHKQSNAQNVVVYIWLSKDNMWYYTNGFQRTKRIVHMVVKGQNVVLYPWLPIQRTKCGIVHMTVKSKDKMWYCTQSADHCKLSKRWNVALINRMINKGRSVVLYRIIWLTKRGKHCTPSYD